RDGGQNIRQFGHMGATRLAAKTVFDRLAKIAQQIHADQRPVVRRNAGTITIVWRRIVSGHGRRNRKLIVDRDAKMHVMDRVASMMHDPRPFGEIVSLDVYEFGLEIPLAVFPSERIHTYGTRV